MGCGSGFVICSAALMLAHLGLAPSTALLAVDHSGAALEATRQTLAAHGVVRPRCAPSAHRRAMAGGRRGWPLPRDPVRALLAVVRTAQAPGRVRLVEADLCGSWQDGLQGQVDLLVSPPRGPRTAGATPSRTCSALCLLRAA